MSKIKVHLVGAPVGQIGNQEVWGGSRATMYAIQKSFEKSDRYELVIRCRNEFKSTEELHNFLSSASIGWLDETHLAQLLHEKGYPAPDVMGPITRSPVKNYNKGAWQSGYTPEWFYKSKILRLNENEEKEESKKAEYVEVDFLKNVNFIRHAINIDKFKPSEEGKGIVLWAGNMSRDAKNYPLFLEIVEKINEMGGLPKGYEFRVMSGYTIEEYIETLKETAILVNTSKYESFCNAVNEARSCGVCTLVQNNFNGKYMFLDQPIQVDYNAESYANKILEILKDEKVEEEGVKARKWVEDNCSPECMRTDIEKVFDKILENKK